MKTHLTTKLSLGALLLAGSLVLSRAASDTWTGSTDGTWATAANWLSNPAVVPGTGDTATFNGLGNGNTTIDLGVGVTVSNLLFDSASVGAYTIGSGGASNQTLTLGQVGGGITVNSTVANSQLLNANLALPVTGFYNLYNDSANTLTLAGGISASSAGSKVLTVDGTGNTTISGLITSGSGNVGLQKTNSGTLTLAGGATFAATNVNCYLPGATYGPVVLRQGTTRITSGTYTVTGEFVLGGVIDNGGPGNNANFTMDGGSMNVSTWLSVGKGNGIGGVSSDVVLNNGAGITSANVSLGYNAGNTNNLPKGSMTLNNNSALNVNGTVYIGESIGSDMTLTVNGSAGVTNANSAGIRVSNGGKGTLVLNGGTVRTEGDLAIGYSTPAPASATVVVNGGNLFVAGTTKRWLLVSRSGSGSAQLVVSNGTVNVDANTDIRFSTLGTSIGTNEVSLRGGSITFYTNNGTTIGGSGVVDLQYVGAPSTYNTFNLDGGGILTVPQVVSSVSSGTRIFNFNGGTLRAATDNVTLMNLGAGNGFAYVRSGGAVIDSNGKNVTIVQPLLHSAIPGDAGTDGGLTKNGAGTLTLAGANTYTGPTRVNAGTLVLSGASLNSPSISLNDAATLSVLGPVASQVAPATMTVGSVSGGAMLNFVALSTTQAPLKPGTLTFNGPNTINIVGDNFVAGNSYPLITYTTLAGSGSYSLGPLPSGVTGNLSVSGNTIYFNVTGVNNTIWTGALNGTWDIGATANWTNAAGGNTYSDGSLVQFDDTGLNTIISNSVPTVLKPSAVLVNNSTKNYAFRTNTIIGGLTGLTKAGTGALTNSTPHTYTGPTVINQGAVVAGVASVANVSGALGNNSAVTLGNDASAVLNLNGFATQIGSLTGGGPGVGNVVLGAGTLTVGGDNTSPGVYAGNISGGGGLTKIGSGTLTLGGTNTFTGTTAVGGGTLTYASGAVQTTTGGLTVGTSGNFGTMNINSGSALTFGNVVSYVGYLNGIGVLNLNGGAFSVANDLRVGGSASSGTDYTGYGTLNMNGGTANLSSLTIARGNDYRNAVSGSVTISGGTMTSTNDVIVGYAGTGAGKLVLNGGTLKVATTATKWLQVGEWDSTSAQVDISSGNLDLNANTSMKFNSGNSSGTHTVNQYGGVVTFYSDFGTNVGGTGNVDLRYTSGSTGTNTYNLNGGTLIVPQITASQATGARVFNFNGGTLRAAVSSASFMNLGSDASVNVRNGGAIIDSNGKDITILSPLAHSAIAGDAATDGGLTKTGNGTLILAGGYTYTGPTVVTGGTLGFNAGQTTPSWVGNTPGDLTVSNAALRVGWSSGSAIPAANLTLIGSNSISFDFGTLSLNPGAAALSASGNLSASGTNVINITAVGLVVGRFPLISAANTISVSNFRLGSLPAGIAASLASSGNTLDLVIAAAGQLLSWHGADLSGNYLTNWDINLSANWYDVNYNLTKYLQYGGNAYGDNVIFGGAAQAALDGTNYVNVTTRLVPATLSFSAGVPYRLTGAGSIDGVTALVLTNMSNTVFLGTSNGYTGGTLVQSGTLEITSDNGLGAVSGGLTMAGGALQIDGSFTSGRAVSFLADTTVGVGAGANAQFTCDISGTGSLNKTDSGILTLKGTNTFSGHFFVHAGTVVLDSGSSYSNANWNSIGAVSSDSGTLTAKGTGSFFTTSDLNVADVASTLGFLNVQDTATVTANNLFVGSANEANSTANGTVNQSGGTVTQVSTSTGNFVIGGRNSGSALGVGTYNLTGGTLKANCGVRLGAYGTGTVNQSGGLFQTLTGGINLARFAGGSGTYNLNGGTLETYNVASSSSSNAVFNFNGGTLLAAANPGNPFMSGLSQANVLAGGAIIDSSSNNISITQGLLAGSAAGGLTKQGPGAVALLGADTYTGPTVINGGSLTVTPAHQAPGAVTLADGTTYAITLPGGPMAVTNGALTLGAGTTTLSFGFGTNGNAAGPLLVCGALTVNGTLNVAMGGISSRFTVGSFPLVKYSGAIAGGGSLNPVIAAPHGMSITLSNHAASSTLYAVVTSLGSGITWSGTNPDPARTNVWDLNSTTNWLVGATPTDYAEVVPPGDAVTFNDSGSGLVLLSNTASPASVTISNSSVNYTFQGSGQVNSTLGLTKLGSATATLNVPGTYSGSTVIANGTLSLGTNQTFANLTGSGTVATASGAPTLTVNNSTDTTFAGSMQGGLGLTKTGNGTLTLTDTNTFTGSVFGRNGTIVLDSGAIYGGTAYSSIGLNGTDSATLTLKGTGTFTNNGDFNVGDIGSATGTLNLSDNATLTVASIYVGSANAAGSTASGTVNQTSGTVQNTYLNIGGRNSTNGVGVYNLSGGTLIGTGTVRAGGVGTGTLNISGTASASFASTSANYVGYRTGTGALNMTGGSFSAAGELRVGGSDANGAQYSATGMVTVANATMSLGALTVARGNYLDNSCFGSVTLNSGSTLISTNDVIVQYAGTGLGKLALNGGTLIVGPAATKWLMVGWYDTGASELDITNGNILLENGTSLKMCRGGNTGGNVINQSGGNVIFYSDAGLTVGGTGNLDLNLGGGSASVSTYNLDGGTLTVPQVIASSSTGSSVLNFNGGTLQAAASSTAFMQGLTAANVRAGGAIIDTATNNVTIAQALVNNGVDEDGGLTKLGNGTLWLNGVNTYTNLTRVVAGTLGGSGTIAGPVTVKSGAGLAPGAGLGTLTVNGNLTLSPGSTNIFEVNGTTATNDVVVLGTSVTYGGVLKIVPSGTFTLGQQFTLFSGAGAVNPGNFAQIVGTPGDRLAFAFANGVLSVVAGNPAPVITAITPNVGRTNGGTFVTITGSEFASGLAVLFGATPAPVVNYSNSTLITAVTPASAPGLVTVTVMNPDSHTATTNFAYVLPPPPAMLSSAVKSGGNLVLTWTGGTNANCLLLSATNVTLPRSSWVAVATNVVLSDGRSTNTILINAGEPKRFYLLSVPYN